MTDDLAAAKPTAKCKEREAWRVYSTRGVVACAGQDVQWTGILGALVVRQTWKILAFRKCPLIVVPKTIHPLRFKTEGDLPIQNEVPVVTWPISDLFCSLETSWLASGSNFRRLFIWAPPRSYTNRF
jgi:hypothetical protein